MTLILSGCPTCHSTSERRLPKLETPESVSSKYQTTPDERLNIYKLGTTVHLDTPAGMITAMVTHWDDQSDAGREVGASLILHRANYEAMTTKRVSHLNYFF